MFALAGMPAAEVRNIRGAAVRAQNDAEWADAGGNRGPDLAGLQIDDRQAVRNRGANESRFAIVGSRAIPVK